VLFCNIAQINVLVDTGSSNFAVAASPDVGCEIFFNASRYVDLCCVSLEYRKQIVRNRYIVHGLTSPPTQYRLYRRRADSEKEGGCLTKQFNKYSMSPICW